MKLIGFNAGIRADAIERRTKNMRARNMNDKSVLELAMDLAFVNCKQDVLREHQKALEAIKTRLDELQRELELIQKVEVNHGQ